MQQANNEHGAQKGHALMAHRLITTEPVNLKKQPTFFGGWEAPTSCFIDDVGFDVLMLLKNRALMGFE